MQWILGTFPTTDYAYVDISDGGSQAATDPAVPLGRRQNEISQVPTSSSRLGAVVSVQTVTTGLHRSPLLTLQDTACVDSLLSILWIDK